MPITAPSMAIDAPPELLRGPERIESGWWDQDDVRRDYYLARTGEGAQVWVFRDRRDGAWYLQGLWA
jgi:protein ImuB